MKQREDYLPIKLSFEGLGDLLFEEETRFSKGFLNIIINRLYHLDKELADFIKVKKESVNTLDDLSMVISDLVVESAKKIILMIDEVDKNSNNQLFLSFLGMLRNKYLLRNEGSDYTFHSVILAGVHDIKMLKTMLRQEDERKYNSPWNIAADFDIEMSFSEQEIESIVLDYSKENNIEVNTKEISEEIYYFTKGYPYLVSKICKIIDEKIYDGRTEKWKKEDVRKAIKILLSESNTLFQSLIKNIENNKELYSLVSRILLDGEDIVFNRLNPLIDLGLTYGIIEQFDGLVKVSNKIFEELIHNYMVSKIRTDSRQKCVCIRLIGK